MITATTMDFGESKQANFVIHNGPKMLSVSVDNSGGRMHSMARADIRLLFADPMIDGSCEDVTSEVFGGGDNTIVRGTIENMERAMQWLRMTRWGFNAL